MRKKAFVRNIKAVNLNIVSLFQGTNPMSSFKVGDKVNVRVIGLKQRSTPG